jgi:hypothetical protein
MANDTKKLIPILVIIGVLMCGCIAVPVLGGIAMIGWLGARVHREAEHVGGVDRIDLSIPADMTGMENIPTDFGGGGSSAKDAARQRMDLAEQKFLIANAQYEAAQAVYEQQRDFNNSQAGRLGAQGIKLPPPQPPDPSLAFEAQAARAAYEAAKAEYEALP